MLPLNVLSPLSPGLLPCQRPLGAVMSWAITAEHCLCCRGSWLAPGELGLSRCYTSLPTITNEQGEGVSYWIDRSLLSSDAAVDPPNQALETGGMDFIWRAQFLNSYFEWEHLLWCMTYADHPCKSSLSTFARTLTWSLKVFEQNCSVIFSRSQRRWYFNDAHLGFWVLELIGDA